MERKIAVLVLFSCLLFNIQGFSQTQTKPKNIILINADDISHFAVSAYGSKSYKTPNLDKLANTGMMFMQCYALPLCTPSRVALMTGMHNGRNYVGGHTLDTSLITLGEIFNRNGYATCFAGKWKLDHDGSTPWHYGFDEYCITELATNAPRYKNPTIGQNGKTIRYTNGEYGPDIVNKFALDFVQKNSNKPFFLYYPMVLVHDPHTPTPDQPGYAENKIDNANFPFMIAYMDKMVGNLVAKLEELGLRENTMILFTGDNGNKKVNSITLNNGTVYGGGKGLLSDEGVHVPLIANMPGTVPVGKNNNLVDFTDFLPTLCDLAGITIPPGIIPDGRSFYNQIIGKPAVHPRESIYHWFSNLAKLDELKESAFNQAYRLYRDGTFFDLEKDLKEKNPLPVSSLNKKEKDAYVLLKKVLDEHLPIAVQGLKTETKSIALKQGQTFDAKVEIMPANATKSSLRWSAENENVAKVDKFGLITAIAKGQTRIIVHSFDMSQTLSITVNVSP